MKKIIFIFAITLVRSFGLMTSEAKAQCPNPAGCIYGNATVTINYSLSRVKGYSYAQADYTAGLNFNPRIEGSIYRTDLPETNLDYRTSTGNGSSVAAVMYLSTSNFVIGKTYCSYTNYFAVRRSGGQSSYIGYFQDCKKITPSPTPTPTTSPTPVITPTPSPTPCPPGSSESCKDLTLAIGSSVYTITPEGIPGETIGKSTLTACVTNSGSRNPVANQTVNFKTVIRSSLTDSGGHFDSFHTGPRPLGKLSKTRGTTNSNGCVATVLTPSHIAGNVGVDASIPNRAAGVDIIVGILTLVNLFGGANYNLIGNENTPEHPFNHWGTQAAVDSLPLIADDYKAQFYGSNTIPDAQKVSYNDMSLPYGGKFDLKKKWSSVGAHDEHRKGINCDTRSSNIPQARWVELNRIFAERGSTRTNNETGTDAPHWHLRFEFGSPQSAAARTPHSLVEDAWWGSLDRESTQAEWESWHTQIVEAKAQGTSQLLEKAKFLQQSLFSKSEYVARRRTDAEFIGDVFWSHFLREPTVTESLSWQNYLQNLPPINTEPRKRRRLLYEIQATAEFERIALSIAD